MWRLIHNKVFVENSKGMCENSNTFPHFIYLWKTLWQSCVCAVVVLSHEGNIKTHCATFLTGI